MAMRSQDDSKPTALSSARELFGTKKEPVVVQVVGPNGTCAGSPTRARRAVNGLPLELLANPRFTKHQRRSQAAMGVTSELLDSEASQLSLPPAGTQHSALGDDDKRLRTLPSCMRRSSARAELSQQASQLTASVQLTPEEETIVADARSRLSKQICRPGGVATTTLDAVACSKVGSSRPATAMSTMAGQDPTAVGSETGTPRLPRAGEQGKKRCKEAYIKAHRVT
jgi:hypothetical protein